MTIFRRRLAVGTALILFYFVVRSLSGVAESLLLAFFGVLLSIVLDEPTTAMARRMPRGLALALVLLALVALVAGSVVLAMPTVTRQVAQLAHALPRGLARAGELWSRVAPSGAPLWPRARERLVAALPSLASRLVPFVGGAVSALSGALVAMAIAVFVAADPEAELRSIARLLPPSRQAAYWALVKRLTATLRQWLLGMIVGLAIVAAFTGVGLWIARVPWWLALALLTFATGFVPYLGSLFTGLVVLGAGLASSPRTALVALAIFVAGQVLHGVVVTPLVNRRAVRMPPALLLPWQLVMTASFGVLGLLAAQPLLAVTMTMVEIVYVERRATPPPAASA